MEYECVRSKECADEWLVEAIDHDNEGVIYSALFFGAGAEARAKEYAHLKSTSGAAYQTEIGALVTLALSCPAMGFAGGSTTEERAQDRWALEVHAEAARLHRLVLGRDPKAVRIIEMIQAETTRPTTRTT